MRKLLLVLTLALTGCMASFNGNVDPGRNTQMHFAKDQADCESMALEAARNTTDVFSYDATNRRVYKNCMIGRGWLEE